LNENILKYIKITKIKGTYNEDYKKKPILLNEEETKEYIRQYIDKEQESRMGYFSYVDK